MDGSRSFLRRNGVVAVTAAASVALHAAVIGGVTVGLPAVGPRPVSLPPPITVALLPAPEPVVASTPPKTPRATAKAPRAIARPAPRPRPTAPSTAAAATTAGAVPVALAVPADPISADAFGASAAPAVEQVGTAEGGQDIGETSVASAEAASTATSTAAGAVADPAAPAADVPPVASVEPSVPAAAALEPDAVRGPLPPPPGGHRQRFRVYWGDFTDRQSVARLEYRFELDGDEYRIETAAQAEGLLSWVYRGTLSQSSAGRIGPEGLEPLRYAEQRGSRAPRSVAFDPDAQRLLPAGGAPAAMPAGTQDRLSVFYQIGLLVRAEPDRFTAGRHYDLPVASMRAVQRERFEVVGDEVLMAPDGPIRALHLRRPTPAGTDDPKIDLWLGYDHQMLPVRLRIEDAQRRVLDQVVERDG